MQLWYRSCETSAAVDDVARLFELNVNVLTRSWRAGFATNGSLRNRDLAVQHYDANGGGGAGGRGKKRTRGRGGASAMSGDRAATGGGVVAAAGRVSGGGARGSRCGASGGGGDAAAVPNSLATGW
jgi:hypothetical protein